VWNGIAAGSALFVRHIGQDGAAQFAFIFAKRQFSQIARERFDMVVVLARVLAQIVARELARSPRFVKRMAQQIVLRYRCLELLEEMSAIHHGLLVRVGTHHYKGASAGRQVIEITGNACR